VKFFFGRRKDLFSFETLLIIFTFTMFFVSKTTDASCGSEGSTIKLASIVLFRRGSAIPLHQISEEGKFSINMGS
jgi:hypothetical protein